MAERAQGPAPPCLWPWAIGDAGLGQFGNATLDPEPVHCPILESETMAYATTRRFCARCERETLHWGGWPATGQEPRATASPSWLAAVWRRLLRRRWRCVGCDHPWQGTLRARNVPNGYEMPLPPLDRSEDETGPGPAGTTRAGTAPG